MSRVMSGWIKVCNELILGAHENIYIEIQPIHRIKWVHSLHSLDHRFRQTELIADLQHKRFHEIIHQIKMFNFFLKMFSFFGKFSDEFVSRSVFVISSILKIVCSVCKEMECIRTPFVLLLRHGLHNKSNRFQLNEKCSLFSFFCNWFSSKSFSIFLYCFSFFEIEFSANSECKTICSCGAEHCRLNKLKLIVNFIWN